MPPLASSPDSSRIVSAYSARAERYAGSVHLVLTTDRGQATLRFTPALAASTALALKQAGEPLTPPQSRAPDAPFPKPSGNML